MTADTPDPSATTKKPFGLLAGITAFTVAATSLVTALTPAGKWIAGQLGPKQPSVVNPAPSLTAFVAQARSTNMSKDACMRNALEKFQSDRTASNVVSKPNWVQANVGGYPMLIICHWDNPDGLVFAVGTTSDTAAGAAINYETAVFPQ
jgi:hypothetical protein